MQILRADRKADPFTVTPGTFVAGVARLVPSTFRYLYGEQMQPIIDHIQITVRDMSIAEPFYDSFLPLLGYDIAKKVGAVIEEHEFHVVEYPHPMLAFAITSPRSAFAADTVHRRKPGALHHLAFRAGSREEVDRVYEALKEMGATIVTPPREYPEYTPPGYYALFLKDPDGIKYEVVCHRESGW